MRSLVLSLFALLFAVAGCAQILGIEETTHDPELGERDTPGPDDSGDAPVRPSCPLLVAYIDQWEVARLDDTALLHGFAVVANQGDFVVNLASLAVDYYGDTHPKVEVDVSTEPWIEEGLRLASGEKVGFVTASAMTILGKLLSLSSENMTDNLLQIDIREWLAAAEQDRSVSAEIGFMVNQLGIEMPMRFTPGDETRPLNGAYACATEI